MRQLTTSLDNILSLISCASDYGFAHGELFESFADMMNRKLTDEEIEAYASDFLKMEGYGEEDYESVKEKLTGFKLRYIHAFTVGDQE